MSPGGQIRLNAVVPHFDPSATTITRAEARIVVHVH
jgi:hypothetical protein